MSDLHINYPGTVDRFRRMVRGLERCVEVEPWNTVVVITGDIVNRIREEEDYLEAREEILALEELGFMRVLMVPGNHDYGRGTIADKRFVPVFKRVFLGSERRYPLLDIIDDIAFLGLDSMAEELDWHERVWTEGELGPEQLERLRILLESDRVRECGRRVLYLHHHPFDYQPFHELKDSRELGAVIEWAALEGIVIDAILYGHHHRGRSKNGHWGISRCYDGGTATLKPRNRFQKMLPWFREVRNATRLMDLDHEPEMDRLVTVRARGDGL
jgi:3',5'-cyclic AMP phosphodiesterase CpdA